MLLVKYIDTFELIELENLTFFWFCDFYYCFIESKNKKTTQCKFVKCKEIRFNTAELNYELGMIFNNGLGSE